MTTHFDVIIVGAGISGVGAAYHLQRSRPNKSFALLEAREVIGGTWDLFRYPGIRSDSDMYTLDERDTETLRPESERDMAPTWQIGDVSIRKVVELETAVPYHPKYPMISEAKPDALGHMPWLKPHFVTGEGQLLTSVHALVVEAPGLLLVVDTCLGNDKPRRMLGNRPLTTEFLALLRAAGCAPERVQAVVCTHLHVDHVGWNTRLENGRWVPTFPNARYLMGRVEYEHWSQERDGEPAAIMQDSVKPLLDAGLVDLVEQDHRLSKEISLLPTPGHTPGHVSVLIESQGARALITGDVMHHPCQVGEPTWSTSFDSDRGAATAMRQQLLAQFADSGVLVIGTHFAHPTAGRIKRNGERFQFEV